MAFEASPIIWLVVDLAQSPIDLIGDPGLATLKVSAMAVPHEHFVADTRAYLASALRQWSMHLVADM